MVRRMRDSLLLQDLRSRLVATIAQNSERKRSI